MYCHVPVKARRVISGVLTQEEVARKGLRPRKRPRDLSLPQRPRVPASYCSTTLAGMRPRSLTGMPLSFAHARMSLLR